MNISLSSPEVKRSYDVGRTCITPNDALAVECSMEGMNYPLNSMALLFDSPTALRLFAVALLAEADVREIES